jgi:hypothetical protein
MEVLIKRSYEPRLRWLTIGCGIQADDCLALAVKGHAGEWRIDWGLFGTRDDPGFARQLRGRVWRRQLWAPPWSGGAEQEMVVCGIDLQFYVSEASARISASEKSAALRTQVMTHYAHASDPAFVCGIELRGPEGARHLVGAAAQRDAIRASYREWRQDVGIIHPHIASNATALANTYLALYPEDERQRQPVRMLVLEGRDITHAVLMNDWRLMDSIQYQMMPGQRLETVLLEQWIQYFQDRHQLNNAPEPCVFESYDGIDAVPEYARWRVFTHAPPVRGDNTVLELMDQHPDLAVLAFGMALQGG